MPPQQEARHSPARVLQRRNAVRCPACQWKAQRWQEVDCRFVIELQQQAADGQGRKPLAKFGREQPEATLV